MSNEAKTPKRNRWHEANGGVIADFQLPIADYSGGWLNTQNGATMKIQIGNWQSAFGNINRPLMSPAPTSSLLRPHLLSDAAFVIV